DRSLYIPDYSPGSRGDVVLLSNEMKRILLAGLAGTTIEYFDFYIATAATDKSEFQHNEVVLRSQ
ncbi:MAG TPA: hypothetical protein VGM89_16895, partial [Puia sp.]